ncbi:hypothetical protein ZWY2020_040487 [Hordeum vulgare]|nr:hypothetical protein ZWY2020_040487 [Hordeum vulgare]
MKEMRSGTHHLGGATLVALRPLGAGLVGGDGLAEELGLPVAGGHVPGLLGSCATHLLVAAAVSCCCSPKAAISSSCPSAGSSSSGSSPHTSSSTAGFSYAFSFFSRGALVAFCYLLAALRAGFFLPEEVPLRGRLVTEASWSALGVALAEEPRDGAAAEGGELGGAMGWLGFWGRARIWE